jgi:hypothetical protein
MIFLGGFEMPNMTRERIIDILKLQGFSFDLEKRLWKKEDKEIPNSILSITSERIFIRVLDGIMKNGNVKLNKVSLEKGHDIEAESRKRWRNQMASAAKHPLPGSYGSGKRK